MAHLTIPVDDTEVEYSIGSASSGPFTIPFAFFQEADIKASIDGVELTINNDYTIDGDAASSGGFTGGSLDLNQTYSNVTLKIYRDTAIERVSNFPNTGPFDIETLNNDLNRITAIAQELETQRNKFLQVDDADPNDGPLNANGRILYNLGESTNATAAATHRQVLAAGPNGADEGADSVVALTTDQWNTLQSLSAVDIAGLETDTAKTFDMISQFFCFLQNRGGAEAEVYFRFRFLVDCYTEVTQQSSSVYRMKIPQTSMLPINFMDVQKSLDYWNGNGTVTVYFDVYPLGSAASNIFAEQLNMTVTTMEPR